MVDFIHFKSMQRFRDMSSFDFKKILIFSATASFTLILSPISSAQEIQIDTNAIEKPSKNPTAKKLKDTNKLADPAKPAAEHKTGGPDRQFGELEGWSPGKEPPKDPKDPNSKATPSSTGGAKVSTTPSGNMGIGLGF
jgi:hypothetical protein